MIFGEHDDCALIFRQLCYRHGNLLANFPRLSVIRDRSRLGRDIEWFGGMSLTIAEPVNTRVASEREEPRCEFPSWPIAADALVDADKHFLCDIVGIAGIVEQPVAKIHNRPLVPAHEFVERGLFAVLEAFDKFNICEFVELHD